MFSKLFSIFTISATLSAESAKVQGRGGALSLVEKEAATAGYGLPGCDKDTFIRYSLIFCSGSSDVKALKDPYFLRLEADVKSFKKPANKELGFKVWKQDTIVGEGYSVCHNSLGEFSPDGDQCKYQFKEENAEGARVAVATDAAGLGFTGA